MNLPRVHGRSFTTTLHIRERSPITEKQGSTGQAVCKPISLLPKGCFSLFHCPSLKSNTSLQKNWTVSNLHFHLTTNNMQACKSLTEKASLHVCSPSLEQQQPAHVPQPPVPCQNSSSRRWLISQSSLLTASEIQAGNWSCKL